MAPSEAECRVWSFDCKKASRQLIISNSNNGLSLPNTSNLTALHEECDRISTRPDAVVRNYEADGRVLPPNASTFRDPSLNENPAAIAEHNEILDNSGDILI